MEVCIQNLLLYLHINRPWLGCHWGKGWRENSYSLLPLCSWYIIGLAPSTHPPMEFLPEVVDGGRDSVPQL